MPSAPTKPEDFPKIVRQALIKGFIIPVLLVAFFATAPAWLNHKVRTPIRDSVQRSALPEAEKASRIQRLDRLDFAAVALHAAPGQEELRAQLDAAGLTGQFQRLAWGYRLSMVLLLVLLGVVTTTLALNRRASRSRAHLISSYRLAWRLSIAAALVKVFLLIPLLAYGTFEFSTLAVGVYLPKLIVLIVVGGLAALWQSFRILTRRVPLEVRTPLARAVAPEQAPLLWADVRAAADRVGTAPPDNILLGMEQNFFVTEVEVIPEKGRAQGRTLHLSVPLMQVLTPEEVLSIIGHELGHFRGEDTQLSRLFAPMRMKAQATLLTMGRAGWVGRSSFHTLLFFHGSFGLTEQAFSRERELAADQVGAGLTSAAVSARALVKVHAAGEAFRGHLARDGSDPFAAALPEMVRKAQAADAGFWSKLLERRAAHPLDSHPSLRVRLGALGYPADTAAAQAAAEAVPGETAAARWLAGTDELLAGVRGAAAKALSHARVVSASYETEEGRRLLDQQFPEIRWKARKSAVYVPVGLCLLADAIFVFLAVVVDDRSVQWLLWALVVPCALLPGFVWWRHRRGEFVLRADALSYSGWKRPLQFADLDLPRTTVRRQTGTILLNFRLKAAAPPIWRVSPLCWLKVRNLTLNLNLIDAKPKQSFEAIERYMLRKPAPSAGP